MRYSIQPRDQIFVKSYEFFAKNIGKNISKNVIGKYRQKILDHLKPLPKEQFKKEQKQLVIWLVTKLLIKSWKFQSICNKIIQRELEMNMIMKNLKKDIYLQKRNRKLLMIWDQYSTVIMEYQRIIDFLENTPNQPSKFMTKNWVEINVNARGTYNTNSQIKFKTSMPDSSLCDYNDAYILVRRTIGVIGAGADAAAITADRNNKQATFENCASFTDCITNINNTHVDNTKDFDVVMPMHNLIEYSDNYSKTSWSLYYIFRNEPNNVITESESFKFKSKSLENINNEGIINAEIAIMFWRTLEIPLINC